MLNTLAIFEDLSRHLDRQAARKIAEILGQVYEEVAETVNKKEFNELKEIVAIWPRLRIEQRKCLRN